MKLEKRSAPVPPPAGDGAETPPSGGKKPVIVYILILFIAAFMLMALSLLMHQRSNTEALVQLNDSIAAMKELQTAQDRIVDLEQKLEETKDLLSQAELQAQAANDAHNNTTHILEETQTAMEWFWQLDEAFLREDFEMCRLILAELDAPAEAPLREYLTPLTTERYQEIREALDKREGEAAP